MLQYSSSTPAAAQFSQRVTVLSFIGAYPFSFDVLRIGVQRDDAGDAGAVFHRSSIPSARRVRPFTPDSNAAFYLTPVHHSYPDVSSGVAHHWLPAGLRLGRGAYPNFCV
ncbi:TPA: hypothetical protein ACKE3D_001583 [Burkholderia dolosa]